MEETHLILKAAREAAADSMHMGNKYKLAISEYCEIKYVRVDNTPENAEYLGYIKGRELYPDFEFIRFADFVDDLIAGEVKRPYPHLQM